MSFLGNSISPDGKFVAAKAPDPKVLLYPIDGGEPRPLAGLAPEDLPIRWSADGRALYVYPRGELPAKVYRFDLATQRKELWKQIMPSDPAGIFDIPFIQVTPDGRFYAYTYLFA